METTFTPGPLQYREDKNGRYHVSAGGCDDLASLYHPAANPGTMEGNARLFAAAPELFEALKKCAAVCAGETTYKGGLIDALESARAAIAKATGEQE